MLMKKIQLSVFTLLLIFFSLLPMGLAIAQLKVTLEGHTDIVWSVAFGPNGQTLASGSWDKTVRLWNVNTRHLLHTFTGHTSDVLSVAFSKDGRTLASASWDGTIRLWNPQTGTLKRILTGHAGGVASVAFSPDGETLASASADQTIWLWNTTTWQPKRTLTGHSGAVDTVAFSPDGRTLASGSRDQTIRLWNPDNGKHIKTLLGHTSDVLRMVFSPDGTTLASGSNDKDQAVRLWNPHTGKPKEILTNQTGWLNPVAFSPDGTMLLIGGHGISVWDTETGQYKRALAGDIGTALSVTFSPDGQRVASGSADNKIRLWESIRFDVPFVNVPFDPTNIPEPVPPPAAVRDFFELDPYYQQWINVRGFPVLASAEVSPYALKEVAWTIWHMIEHRPDILKIIAENMARFSVVPDNKEISDIPEYSRNSFLIDLWRPGIGDQTASAPEETVICGYSIRCSGLVIHEFAHQLHHSGLNKVDPTFDRRLETLYNMAVEEGLYQGNYALTNYEEYWAVGVVSWFNGHHPDSDPGAHSRSALKKYDPRLAKLLSEVFGDRSWRYTPPETRMHLPHLQGFNSQEAPIYQRTPELLKLEEQLRDPQSNGDGKWVDLKLHDPSELPVLVNSAQSDNRDGTDFIIIINLTRTVMSLYSFNVDGRKNLRSRVHPGGTLYNLTEVGALWLIQDHTGKDFAVFRAEEQVGRVLIRGTPSQGILDVNPDVALGPPKITGPWLWMIAPTKASQGGARSNNVDSLAQASNGRVTEADVAANGAREGDAVGNYVWTLGEISATGGDNVNNLLNKIGLGKGDVNHHSSYALITLESATDQFGVTMRVGSDDSIKVWVNGEIIHNNPINRGANDFQDTFKVNLVAGDNLLLVKVSERDGGWSMFVGIEADVNAVYKRPPDPRVSEDVNGDGMVNIQDLVLVASSFGKTGQNTADVNGDGVVNIADLVLVAGALGNAAAAPKAYADSLGQFTAEEVRQWLTEARLAAENSPIYRRGTLMLEHLLRALTPKETALLPNYPNPFNPETWIPYQLAKPADVTLHIYATDGRLVRTLDLGYQPVGSYESRSRAAYWDGKNALGEPVASGVYFYTLTAGEFTATRKMLIRK